jgi:hypothetical protein
LALFEGTRRFVGELSFADDFLSLGPLSGSNGSARSAFGCCQSGDESDFVAFQDFAVFEGFVV